MADTTTFTVKDRFIERSETYWFVFIETTDNRLYYASDYPLMARPPCSDATIEQYVKFAPNTTHTVSLQHKYEIVWW